MRFASLVCWVAMMGFGSLQAQPPDSLPGRISVRQWSAGVHYGSVFAHSEEVQNTAGARPRGVELQMAWQRGDQAVKDLCNCYPRQGVLLAYYDFDNAVLGRGVMAGWLLEPTWRLNPTLSLSLRGVAGGGWMSNPFDSERNPTNMSYSVRMNAYLLYGMGLTQQITPHWQLSVNGNFQHISNGGLRQPNKGINWPTASLHATYTPQPQAYYTGTRSTEKTWLSNPWRKEIGIFGIAKRSLNPNGTSTRLPVAGLHLMGSRQVSRLSGITFGAEGSYDVSLRNRLKRDSLDISAVRVGLLAGHEFLLGRFNFSQRVGLYVYNPSPYYQAWFHRWGLQYRFAQHWWFGVNLKAHLHVADYLDARLIYSW